MMKKKHDKETAIKIMDVVALLKDIPRSKLLLGQVGTVVEKLDDGVVEVEFADKKGKVILCLALEVEDLMLLHFESQAVA